VTKIKLFLQEIRVEHTSFALPFAYVGAVFAAHSVGLRTVLGQPLWLALIWITLAVLGARTAAMAANRYLDRDIDKRNPRTARRALATGELEPSVMLWGIAIGLLLLLVAAWQLNPLCVKLMPLAAIGVLIYPLCKRFTWLTHFVLGVVDALAPLGAFIGITGTISVAAVLLFVAVTVWVAGFDIIYALMDLPTDTEQGISSLPARFGASSGRWLPLVLHSIMVVALAAAGLLVHAGIFYYLGVVVAIVLVFYENHLFDRTGNVFVLNERIFSTNMRFSWGFLLTTILGFVINK